MKDDRSQTAMMPAVLVNIHPARPSDLEFVSADHKIPVEAVSQLIKQSQVYVATLGDTAVGYARIEFLWSKLPYIALLVVLEWYRSRGAGRALLAKIGADALLAGHTQLYSSSQADEPSPQAWHRHMAFAECGYIAGINQGGVGEVFFRKPLGQAI